MLKKLYGYLIKLRIAILRKKYKINKSIIFFPDIRISHPLNLNISDYVYIGRGANIQSISNVQIGRGTIIGPYLSIYSANHRFRDANFIPYDDIYIKKPVVIGENVWIGGHVIIVPGTVIGEGCIVGAGAVVSGNIPPFSIIAGNPCKIIGQRNTEAYLNLKQKDQIYMKFKVK